MRTPRQPAAAAPLLRGIGLSVLVARKRLGMSQIAVAKLAGVSRFTMHRIESGKAVESWALALVLDALGMSLVEAGNAKL